MKFQIGKLDKVLVSIINSLNITSVVSKYYVANKLKVIIKIVN